MGQYENKNIDIWLIERFYFVFFLELDRIEHINNE